MKRALFFCAGNSARSQMAEGLYIPSTNLNSNYPALESTLP